MRLIYLTTRKLYGTLNLNLKFFSDLNILVGINGSGKTSALSVIDWLLTLNLGKLATVPYEQLSLTIELNSIVYVISADRSDVQVVIYLQSDADFYEPISVSLRQGLITRDAETYYKNLSPEKHELKAWNFIKSIKNPTIVSLERTITAEIEDEVYLDRPSSSRVRQTKRPTTPIEYVQRIFADKYAEYRQAARINDATLKSEIILAALDSPLNDEILGHGFFLPAESTEQLEEKVKGYLSASIPDQNVEILVQRFFTYFRQLQKEVENSTETSDKVMNLVQSQFLKVDKLARAFATFEQGNARAFSQIKAYLNSVNEFLKDSGKNIVADDNTGMLAFTDIKASTPHTLSRQISKLSSGETQIIILFALIAFEASERSVFIVDEPELSLHPKWQTEFMNSFLKLCPKNAQIFIATHSPEIVAGRRLSCVFF
ncbi:ATP-binding protein [Acetobacter sacchari]|uniref:ATP-binding protein n=1 Tax=Acetobacter sacchari TaxID=2661687 RepID=A0ABS3M047_9PROT|nr:AAA family ATPase [Acetobacter sacchari]MBO1361505.1 ATP-binding protein [Acetobacter sacchari]